MDLARIPQSHQLQPLDLSAPGFRGINTAQSGAILAPQWATEAFNAVLDPNGRLAARLGFTNQTTTPIGSTPNVKTIFEHRKGDGTVADIIAWDGGISTSFSNPPGSDISGAVTDANGSWYFQNYNDKIIGFQAGVKFIVRTTGNFAHVVEAAGASPQGGIGLAAYGRIWGVNADLQTIQYSSLLDETTWTGGSSGTIDLRNVWTHGTDSVTAIAAFNGSLVVFGKKHILFWQDTSGNKLGLDPTNMKVTDIITGTGCLTQFSLQPVGDTDLLFLSPTGVQSIQRLLIQKSNPVANLTKYVRDDLMTQIAAETIGNVRSTYNQYYGFYALALPTSKYVWILDQKRRYQDEQGDEVSIVTRWGNFGVTAMFSRLDNALYLAKDGGKVAKYIGKSDDGNSFRFVYRSPWLDLGQEIAQRLKILKRISAIVYSRQANTVTIEWGTDFADLTQAITLSVVATPSAEWGVGEYSIAEWSGGQAFQFLRAPARDRGQFYRLQISAYVADTFSLQQASLFAKIGRLAG